MRTRTSIFTQSLTLLWVLGALFAAALGAQENVRLAAADRLLGGQPARIFSIGEADGRSWEVLSGVGAVAFDREDNLYVLDRGNHRVLVFDPRGAFVRQIGRRGQGPGEFTQPSGMTITRDGMIVVMDVGRQNFSIFSRAGAFQRSVRLMTDEGIPTEMVRPHPAGGVVIELMPLMGTAGARGHSLVWYRLGASDAPARLLQLPPDASPEVEGRRAAGIQINVMSRPAFAPQLHWVVLPSARVGFANTPEYRVSIAGTPARHLTRAIAPRRVTEQDRAAERERQVAQLASRQNLPPVAQQALRRQVENLQFANTIPVIRGLATDPAGRLWIARNGRTTAEGTALDVLAPDGRYVGTIRGQRLPQAFSTSGRIARIETDELGVQRVHVYRMPAGWR